MQDEFGGIGAVRFGQAITRDRARRGEQEMHRPALMKLVLVVGVLVVMTLALTGCSSGGSAQEEAKARPLPLYATEKTLRPGEYHSVKFKPPLSFEVGEGWSNTEDQLPDFIQLRQQGNIGALTFANVKEVFKPGTTNVEEAPKDLVGWLQHHPYLKTSKPQPVTVGGLKGEQLEVLVDHLPKDPGYCGEPSGCLDIFNQSGGDQIGYFARNFNERRVIVLENVKGDTVVIWYAGPPDTFDKFAPKARKVVNSVRWEGS
jgi:hypothetical protein